ncbi:MAG: cell wall hydrolase [Oscillospiraceae bacterium]|nr:cell wall hydrolase [Oscillospiraceae bacterium]MBR4101681.1 cell wall hydrolase [Oscillospiraceae bacterium]MBR6618290.1 cell wall hydrolase [Oscillospiraceae bacterium]
MLKRLSAKLSAALLAGCCIINLSMANMITAEAAYTANETEVPVTVEMTMGDVDANGIIDPLDAVAILSEVALTATGGGTASEEFTKYADVNNDSEVNAGDASIVLAYSCYVGAGGSEEFTDYLKQFTDPFEEPVAPQEPDGITGNIVTLTSEEQRLLAALVTLEVGTESYECQKAIASLVINRMLTSGSTLTEVIYAKNQFSVAGKVASKTPSESCVKAVDEVLTTGTTLPIYVTFFRSSYYHSWGDQVPYGVMDHTYFSYSKALKNKYV